MKPDFDSMSKAELKAYVLAHRHDNEAFYKLASRYEADSKDRVWNPCPKTPEDWVKVSELVKEQIELEKGSQEKAIAPANFSISVLLLNYKA